MGFSGIECLLFGRLGNVECLRRRLISMGAKAHAEKIEKDTVYVPMGTSSHNHAISLHLLDDGVARRVVHHLPSNYSDKGQTNTVNIAEANVLEGDAEALFQGCELVKTREYLTILFESIANQPDVSLRAVKEQDSDEWTLILYGRCKDHVDFNRIEEQLLRTASYIDDIVKLSVIDFRKLY